jgi:hypothetical protein
MSGAFVSRSGRDVGGAARTSSTPAHLGPGAYSLPSTLLLRGNSAGAVSCADKTVTKKPCPGVRLMTASRSFHNIPLVNTQFCFDHIRSNVDLLFFDVLFIDSCTEFASPPGGSRAASAASSALGATGGRGGGMYQPVYAPFLSLVERDMNVSAAPLSATPGPGSYAVPAGNAAVVITPPAPVVSNFKKKCIMGLSREIFFACKI